VKSFVRVLLLLVGCLLFVSAAYAEVKFDYGADFRLRQEIWDNVVDLGTSQKDRNFLRLRSRVWGKADFTPDLGAYLRITNEAKWYGLGPYEQWKTNPNLDEVDPDELIFDNLYADAKNIGGLPIDLRIGRQDFIGTYGEGFLMLDGTPGDGSRTFYFNAAKVNVRLSPNFNFDLTYIDDPRTDTFMPSWHPAITGGNYVDNKRVLTGSHEQAFVLYGRGKIGDGLVVEPYYVYKTEDPLGSFQRLKLNTVGGHVVYTMAPWKFGGEFAHQFGKYSANAQGIEIDRQANGGYAFGSYTADSLTWKPEFELRYVYLSGDDPGTPGKNETWDPLFSRAPYWNELIIYTLIGETAKYGGAIPGYWTNMQIAKATAKLNFTPATNLSLAYQYLWAVEQSGTKSALLSNNGLSRGSLPTAILSHKFTKNLDGMLQFEYFFPGNYYASDRNALFFRWQLQVKI